MNDTPPDVDQAITVLMMQRSETERAMMAFEMFDLARALMTADIRARHPGISEVELRVQIFDRTCGADFDTADRARIIRGLRGGELIRHVSTSPSARRRTVTIRP